MKKGLFQIVLLVAIADPSVAGRFQQEKIYTVSEVSVKPQPVKGLDDFQKRWSREGKYPEKALKEQVQGVVYIEFIVNRDGTITDAAVKSGVGSGCDEAALKSFKEVSKEPWKPGLRKGESVKVKMVLPYFFRIVKR